MHTHTHTLFCARLLCLLLCSVTRGLRLKCTFRLLASSALPLSPLLTSASFPHFQPPSLPFPLLSVASLSPATSSPTHTRRSSRPISGIPIDCLLRVLCQRSAPPDRASVVVLIRQLASLVVSDWIPSSSPLSRPRVSHDLQLAHRRLALFVLVYAEGPHASRVHSLLFVPITSSRGCFAPVRLLGVSLDFAAPRPSPWCLLSVQSSFFLVSRSASPATTSAYIE